MSKKIDDIHKKVRHFMSSVEHSVKLTMDELAIIQHLVSKNKDEVSMRALRNKREKTIDDNHIKKLDSIHFKVGSLCTAIIRERGGLDEST
jgi:hypothetical protein